MKIVHINRKKRDANFSIELIFKRIRQVLIETVEIEALEVPKYNDALIDKLFNWRFVYQKVKGRNKSVWHITGEVHYVGIFMPSKKNVLTIHDCGFVHRKKGWQRAFVTWLYLKLPLRYISKVVTTTEEVRRDIENLSGYPSSQITIIPVPVKDDLNFSEYSFNKEKPLILQIGTSYNKNIERLIAALEGVPSILDIVGKLSEHHIQLLKDKKIDYRNSVGLTDEEIRQKYEACDLVTFVSTFEGFGMPIVEANSVGRPVVTSSISSMPEVAGKAACLVNPLDVSSIREGILKVIENQSYREELIRLGLENKKRFELKEIAQQYLAIYKELAAK